MKKICLLVMAICMVGSSSFAECHKKDKEVTLRILETSDVHGNFFPYNFIEQKNGRGSMARVSSYVKQQRALYGDNCLLMDNGDILQGQPTAYYYNYMDTVSTHLVADMMNYMGYCVGNMGNHDVETGHSVYDRWISQCHFPVLGANIVRTDTGEPYLKPYHIIERDGVKVAVLGMITPAIPCWLPENLWSGLRFEDMEACAEKWMKIIRERECPDVVIGLFHAGKSGSMLNGIPENPSLAVAQHVPGFDVVLIGHDHVSACFHSENVAGKEVWVLDPNNSANWISAATIKLTLHKGKVVEKKIEGELIDVNKCEVDAEFMTRFEKQYAAVQNFVSRKIGTISETINSSDCYFGSSAFIDLIHTLQINIAGADISICAPLSFNAEIKKGDIHVSDMFNLYKYENMLYLMKLSGKEIKGLLEMSYALWTNTMTSADDHLLLFRQPVKKGERNSFANPSFNFDSAAGIIYTVDVTKPEGQKITITSLVNGSPFCEDAYYKVAVNSYRGNGGGDLLTKGAGISKEELSNRIIYATDKDLRYYLMQYIEQVGKLEPKNLHQWHFVPEEWTKPAAERDKVLLLNNQ